MSAGCVPPPRITPLKVAQTISSRNCVEADTPIEIRSDLADTDIYFTLDGSVPQPFAGVGQARETKKYRGPITLPGGNITIKAVTVAKGRESRIIAKSFQVAISDKNSVRSGGSTSLSRSRSAGATPKFIRRSIKTVKKVPNDNLSEFQTYDVLIAVEEQLKKLVAGSSKPGEELVPVSEESKKIASILICPECCAPRSTPLAKFCGDCGHIYAVENSTISHLPETGAMGTCPRCQTYVSLATGKCSECDVILQPVQKFDTKKKVCTNCSFYNSVQSTNCKECGASLLNSQIIEPPPMTIRNERDQSGVKKTCHKCKSKNFAYAKFCISCGVETECAQCFKIIYPGSRFCSACGALAPLIPMAKAQPFMAVSKSGSTSPQKDTMKSPVKQGAQTSLFLDSILDSISTPLPDNSKVVNDKGPRNKQVKKVSKETQTIDMTKTGAILSAVSPGKGYWRQQVDHITANVRKFMETNEDFRNEVSHTRLGKLCEAVAEENNGRLSIWLDFEIVKHEITEPVQSKYMAAAQAKAFRIPLREKNKENSKPMKSDSKPPAKVKREPVKKEPKPLTRENEALLMELSSSEKNIDEVERLLEDGADANCQDLQSNPAIEVAVKNFFPEAIDALVKFECNLDLKYTSMGNTALHEAVLLGSSAKHVVQTLLSCGADATIKNNRGQDAQTLAIKNQQHELADIIAAHVSHQLLKDL